MTQSKKNGAVPHATELAAGAPAPKTQALIARVGEELSAAAIEAWGARVAGASILELAHRMGVTIEDARRLIKEAYEAVSEDLRENINLNRQLDLERIDHLISSHYAQALGGNAKAADVVLKLLAHRSKLTGIEPLPETAGRRQPESVLIWIQQQLPSINRIVDSLPLE
jgi:hypothetical protein